MSHTAQSLCIEMLEPRRQCAAISGFTGTYFSATTFGGTSVTRIDPAIAFDWGKSAPAAGISGAHFSARWTADLRPTSTGTAALYVSTEGGVRVWAGHHLVLNRWAAPGAETDYKVRVAVTAGAALPVLVEYHHDAGRAAIGMSWIEPGAHKAVVAGAAVDAHAVTLQDQIDHTLMFAADRLGATYRSNTPADGFPNNYTPGATKWALQPATDWTSGTFAGAMWSLNSAFPGAGWDALATAWTTPLATVHQVGDEFDREWAAYKPLLDATGSAAAKKILLASAALKMTAWDKTVRAFRTPGLVSTSGNKQADFGVLMDQTMDMPLLLWAGRQTGDAAYRDRVLAHMNTVAAAMVRDNGSVVQRGYFDSTTGHVISLENYQGYSNTSTWSRAQAWAINSFSAVAAATNDATTLATAKKVANYYIANVPADGVPYWDFNSPKIPKTYRDTSAAAVAAEGLIQLSRITTGADQARYAAAAAKILGSLMSPTYLAESATVKGVLQHGAANVPKNAAPDASLMFGDYYLLKSINDLRQMTSTSTS